MDLNLRNVPDELAAQVKRKAIDAGKTLRDFVIDVLENALTGKADGRVDDSFQVTCPMCGESGPLVRFGDNARCWHCGSGFPAPERI